MPTKASSRKPRSSSPTLSRSTITSPTPTISSPRCSSSRVRSCPPMGNSCGPSIFSPTIFQRASTSATSSRRQTAGQGRRAGQRRPRHRPQQCRRLRPALQRCRSQWRPRRGLTQIQKALAIDPNRASFHAIARLSPKLRSHNRQPPAKTSSAKLSRSIQKM